MKYCFGVDIGGTTVKMHRQKQMGYNAAQELYKRVQNSLTKRK